MSHLKRRILEITIYCSTNEILSCPTLLKISVILQLYFRGRRSLVCEKHYSFSCQLTKQSSFPYLPVCLKKKHIFRKFTLAHAHCDYHFALARWQQYFLMKRSPFIYKFILILCIFINLIDTV